MTNTEQRELVMSISLTALEHLGINLYSNIPAVLAEIVANAWDADAKEVSIRIDTANDAITVKDDGVGMDRDGVIDRFLTIGYKKRADEGELTPGGRRPMGRKGIGKLSIFSIAGVAAVCTIKNGQQTAFRMVRDEIQQAIKATDQADYKPDEIPGWFDEGSLGTEIRLSQLTKSLTKATVNGLRKRVSRRFSVIGLKYEFNVIINDDPIGPVDRGYHPIVQYLWTYGDQNEFVASCTNLDRRIEDRSSYVESDLESDGLTLTGWIGTVAKPVQLKDEEDEDNNLNRIAIFMRGKIAQEDVLGQFGFKEIFADYLVGELHCEQLDQDDKLDIATSSRQALKEDDPRYARIRDVIRKELRYIASKWSDYRREQGVKVATSIPVVNEWLEQYSGDVRKHAERWVGRHNTIRTDTPIDQRELIKASILAFESFRRKQELSKLDELGDDAVEATLDIFKSIDDLEVSYYGQIAKNRMQIIGTLQKALDDDAKERVIQEYIFEHLWLLDPSWERATGTQFKESRINQVLKDDTDSLSPEEKAARIDIGYRTAAGKHIIVELKRGSVHVDVDDLTKQIRKYRDGVRKILDDMGKQHEPIEIICLLGKRPKQWSTPTGPRGVTDGLKIVDARHILYAELLENAEKAYDDYLKERVKTDRLWKIFEGIENFALPSGTT